MTDLPRGREIEHAFRECGDLATERKIRTLFHPDQFVVLNSPRASVVEAAIGELVYQSEVAEWIGADVVNIHGGGRHGGTKEDALARLLTGIERLPPAVRSRLSLENDDAVFTPDDLLPVCRQAGVPLVYDVHHHRCAPDDLSEEDAAAAAIETWPGREPVFHVSSPRNGWHDGNPRPHADYIDPRDVPRRWLDLDVTVEVEAKAKEAAVARLRRDLASPPPDPSREA